MDAPDRSRTDGWVPASLSPGSLSPGSLSPGPLSPGSLSPGSLSPGSLVAPPASGSVVDSLLRSPAALLEDLEHRPSPRSGSAR